MSHLRPNMAVNNNPPRLGEIRTSEERGLKTPYYKAIWLACSNCKKERWVGIYDYRDTGGIFCRSCGIKQIRGNKNPHWKGGRVHRGKYIRVKLQPDDFFYELADSYGYALEHRLVMAKHLGRNLHPWEIVHHKHTKYPAGSREDKQDNRIENLQLVSDDRHNQITIMENRVRLLENKITELKAEMFALRTNSKGERSCEFCGRRY